MATTVTAAHYFIWNHLCASMQARPNPTSELRFVTPDKESSMNTLWQEKGFRQIAAESRWRKKAAESDKIISVKEHKIERHDFNPTTFYEYFFLESKAADWCCFYYFIRSSLVALLEALCARILFSRFVYIGFSWYFFVCARPLSLRKAVLPPLSTRLLCLVVAIPLVCWLYMCVSVCVPLYVHMKMCG